MKFLVTYCRMLQTNATQAQQLSRHETVVEAPSADHWALIHGQIRSKHFDPSDVFLQIESVTQAKTQPATTQPAKKES